jgi:hypothetical protein
MAQLKNQTEPENFMQRHAREQREFDEKHPVLDTRYYVEEYDKREGWYVNDDRTPRPLF